MLGNKPLQKVLVVLSPDLVRPDRPMESALIQRAVALAKATHCSLELFHVCYDGQLEPGLFSNDKVVERERRQLMDRDATQLAEMAVRLGEQQVDIRYDVRWGYPRTEAILRKLGESQPDMVMKQARDKSYVLGLSTSTDWELARRSPAHVWFVNDRVDSVDCVVAGIDAANALSPDPETAPNHKLLDATSLVRKWFGSDVYVANACKVAAEVPQGVGMGGIPVVPVEEQEDLSEQVISRHRTILSRLAHDFDIEPDNVIIRDGHPASVIPDVAENVAADMIVMGARSIGRFERFATHVTVEPVLADARCDILVIRDDDGASAAEASSSTRRSHSAATYDLERAIVDPETVFDSPQQVATLATVSVELRERILQAWEYDVRSQMRAETEGGPVADVDANAINDIKAARDMLESTRKAVDSDLAALHR